MALSMPLVSLCIVLVYISQSMSDLPQHAEEGSDVPDLSAHKTARAFLRHMPCSGSETPRPHPLTPPGMDISSQLFYPQERDNRNRPNSGALTGMADSESQG